ARVVGHGRRDVAPVVAIDHVVALHHLAHRLDCAAALHRLSARGLSVRIADAIPDNGPGYGAGSGGRRPAAAVSHLIADHRACHAAHNRSHDAAISWGRWSARRLAEALGPRP